MLERFKAEVSRWTGHLWTVMPTVRHRLRPRRAPAARPWQTTLDDPDVGSVVIRGLYRRIEDADTLVVALHGLGGHPESAYMIPTAGAVDEAGFSCLRLALRGSGGRGVDFYHAGLTDDLHAALADELFERYARIFVIGYSLGGHVSLCATTEERLDERVAAVAAVSPPIDLAAGVRALDSPRAFVYRQYILRELVRMYADIAARAPVPTPVERIRRVRKLREWDSLTVVPRFGFDDVDDYYATTAIAGRVEQIERPTILVTSRHDPMIPIDTVEPVLARAPQGVDFHLVEGAGHVFFPPELQLGYGDMHGLVPQILHWLVRTG